MLHSMFESLPNPFALLAFVKFVTMAFFEMGLVILILSARRVLKKCHVLILNQF